MTMSDERINWWPCLWSFSVERWEGEAERASKTETRRKRLEGPTQTQGKSRGITKMLYNLQSLCFLLRLALRTWFMKDSFLTFFTCRHFFSKFVRRLDEILSWMKMAFKMARVKSQIGPEVGPKDRKKQPWIQWLSFVSDPSEGSGQLQVGRSGPRHHSHCKGVSSW